MIEFGGYLHLKKAESVQLDGGPLPFPATKGHLNLC